MEFPNAIFEEFIRDHVKNKLNSRLVVSLSEIAAPFRLHLPKLKAIVDNERLDQLLVAALLIEGGMEIKAAASRPKDRLFVSRRFHGHPYKE